MLGTNHLSEGVVALRMVSETERDGETWYECDACGLMFDDQSDASAHEANCDAEDPSYIQ